MPQHRAPHGRHRPTVRRGREPHGDGDDDAPRQGLGVVTIGGITLAVIGILAMWLVWGSSPTSHPLPPAETGAATTAPATTSAFVKPTEVSPIREAAVSHRLSTQPFVRGINLGGDSVTIDGQRWLSYAQALANGLELGSGTAIVPPAPISASGIDFDIKAMLESGCASNTTVQLIQRLPNGPFDVTLWVAGASGVNHQSIAISLLGNPVNGSDHDHVEATWARLGPFPVTIATHALDIAVSGLGGAHVAGMSIEARGPGEANMPPVVSLLRPEADAQLYPGDVPLVADVIPANGHIATVVFFDGTERLGESPTPPYRMTWRDAAVGVHRLSAVASDVSGVQGRSQSITVTIKQADGSPEQLLDHAKDALRHLGLEPSILHQEQDGLHVFLVAAPITTISFLAGLPIVELDITDTKVTDISPLAMMPLKRLTMHNVKATDFSVLAGLPLVELRMVKCGIADLTPLSHLRLEVLQIAANPVKNLAPLVGMPLRELDLDGTPIEDITPLKGLPLANLNLAGTHVRDLAPLAGMPLHRLNLYHCPLTSIAVIHGLPLQELSIEGLQLDVAPLAGLALTDLNGSDSSLRDASVLKGMPLQRLNLWHCPLTSIEPLKGMPLLFLVLGMTDVDDLTPLAGMAITELNINNCMKIRSLKPLATLTALQQISLPARCPDAESLRQFTALRIFYGAHDKPIDVGTFLTEYRAAQPGTP